MKKFFLSVILTIVLGLQVYAEDYYAIGLEAFQQKDLQSAYKNFEAAIKINPQNVNARYYLAQVYLLQNRISEAKDQYKRIILLNPSSHAAILSQKGLSLIKQAEEGIKSAPKTASEEPQSDLFSKYKDNYLDYVLTSNGLALKWNDFPVNVYIEPKKQKDVVKKAFKEWEEKSGLAKFTFAESPQNAQITVNLKDKLEDTSKQESYIAGYSKPYCSKDKIIKSEINILTINPGTNKDLDDNFIYFSTLHEIGHSLGFRGHSPDKNDVMYPVSTDTKTGLTQRDLNTLTLLYKVNSQTLQSRNKGSTDVHLQQALEYVKRTPNKSVGWANLGDIYKGKKMYSQAITNYQKAISIEPAKAELYNLLGSTYAETRDTTKAFMNLKRAYDLDSKNSFYLYQFAKFCYNNDKKEIGEQYLNNYIKSYPESISDEKIKALQEIYN